MTGFKDRFSVGLPRTAVIIHDLCMVWFAWTGLHQFRYAIEALPPVLPLWSMTTAIVLVAQGLVLWQVRLYRAWMDYRLGGHEKAVLRVLILGAGQAGEALVRDLRRGGAYQPVGFLDDAPKLRGSNLQGVPILGRIDEVERIAPETAARLLIIAIPSLDAASMRRIVAACERTGIPFRTVPRLDDLLEGRSLPGELKEVAIEDLLGRQPVT